MKHHFEHIKVQGSSVLRARPILEPYLPFFILSRYPVRYPVSCENRSQFPHFLKVPVITAVSQTVWKVTQSLRGLCSRDLTISEDSDVPPRPRSLSPAGADVSQDFHLPAPPPPVLPIKVCVLILALYCNTHGHESALLRIALVQPLRSRECRLINNTALLTPGLVAGKTDANHRNLSGLFFPAVPVVMVLLLACLILSSKWFFFKRWKGDGRRQRISFDVLIGDWSGEEWDYWLAECCQIFEQRSKELQLPQCCWTACELLGVAPESFVIREAVAFNARFLHTRLKTLMWNYLACKMTY